MSTSGILTIGSVIKHRGAYNASTIYYTSNQVTMYNCVFQAISNNFNGIPPLEKNTDGTIKLANTSTWKCIIDNTSLYNAALSTNNLDARIGTIEDNVNAAVETSSKAESIASATQESLKEFENTKDEPNGLAILDDGMYVPQNNLPTSVFNILDYDFTVEDVTAEAIIQGADSYTGICYDTVAKRFYAYLQRDSDTAITYYKAWYKDENYHTEKENVPRANKLYYNTSDKHFYYWNGTNLVYVVSPQIALTQEEYDALVASDMIDKNAYYNILEDDE